MKDKIKKYISDRDMLIGLIMSLLISIIGYLLTFIHVYFGFIVLGGAFWAVMFVIGFIVTEIMELILD